MPAPPTFREFRAAMGWPAPKSAMEADQQWAQYDQWVWEQTQQVRAGLEDVGLEAGLAGAMSQQVIESLLGEE